MQDHCCTRKVENAVDFRPALPYNVLKRYCQTIARQIQTPALERNTKVLSPSKSIRSLIGNNGKAVEKNEPSMNWDTLPYFIPYLLSLTISTLVGAFTWRRRDVNGAQAYAWVAWGQALWTLGYIFELGNTGIRGKIFWDDIQFIAGEVWFFAFLAFCVQYTGLKLSRPKLIWGILAVIPLAFVLFIFTESAHHLIRPSSQLIIGSPFSALEYDFTLPVWIWAGYGYGLFLVGIALLVARFFKAHPLYRVQVGIIIAGTLIPLIGTALTLLEITFTFHRDTTPLTFAISNLIVGWGLFRRRLFDVVPVARDAVLESMNDAVIVLDTHHHIVDLNPAARTLFSSHPSDLIAFPASELFAEWPSVVGKLDSTTSVREELIFEQDGQRYLRVEISPVVTKLNRLAGQLVIIRDITERKRSERELQSRTEQLEIAYERLEAANLELQALSQVKDQFVANVSHELRTPITSIKLHLPLMKIRPERRDAYLQTLEREVERLENLIEGLLTLSRLDQDRTALKLEQIDLLD